MYPGLSFGIYIVLINWILVWESSLHLTDIGVNLFPAILIYCTTNGPYHTELEPQLYHPAEILMVQLVHLCEKNVFVLEINAV